MTTEKRLERAKAQTSGEGTAMALLGGIIGGGGSCG